ncbi:MAG: ABC-F family ATP-binding cassette domain-containing protein [Candidatus Aminicenantales bacterium]
MIAVENLSKRYGEQVLFDNISFKINRKERVGVVGRNGHGKTTLFRLIAGCEEPDAGSIVIPKNYRIGYVEQEINFTEDTVLKEASKGLSPEAKDQTWRVEKILAGLGFGKEDLERPPLELAGGFQVRLNLTKVLLSDYSMLLLDEPNNYLDITSIRWLTRFLLSWPGELMLITHDRGFMDRVVTHTLAIHRRKVRKIAGDTGKLYAQIALQEETYEKTRINDERKRKEIEDFISKFRAKAQLVGLVQSRKKTLAKMIKREKLEKIKSLDFDFSHKPFHGKYAMTVNDISFGYVPDKPLIRDFNISIGAHDRVFVIGKNGKGKTTLLKLLAGVLSPEKGEISTPLAVSSGYFEQTHVHGLGDSNTVLEEIASASPDRETLRTWNICGLVMFEGKAALKKIRVLSGGEKSRVLLGKLMAAPLNLLLLDEPTNHLDMESSDALLAALDNFEGAVVMVTHNEMFLDALAERLIVFQDDGLTVYEGGYPRFLEKVGWKGEEKKLREKDKDRDPGGAAGESGRKELRRLRSEIIAERSRVLRPLEEKISSMEKAIEEAEKELSRMNQEIVQASQAGESARIVELSKSIHFCKEKINSLSGQLEPLLQDCEAQKSQFERKLRELD